MCMGMGTIVIPRMGMAWDSQGNGNDGECMCHGNGNDCDPTGRVWYGIPRGMGMTVNVCVVRMGTIVIQRVG